LRSSGTIKLTSRTVTNDSSAYSLRDALNTAQNGDLINFSALCNSPRAGDLHHDQKLACARPGRKVIFQNVGNVTQR
jgi:hypothetical protein